MNRRDQLAKTIWEASRADEGTISYTGANVVAAALERPLRMREECIALEAVAAATRSLALRERRTTGEIADEAIAKVDAYCERGELGLLYHSWTRDPDRG